MNELHMDRRTVFFVSDQTGVTAETMGHSLLTQFDGLEFGQVTLPFIATVDKAEEAVRRINAVAGGDGMRPIVFSTLVQDEICATVIKRRNGLFLDFFDAFLGAAGERARSASLRMPAAARTAWRISSAYTTRIDATNFALANDDGAGARDYERPM